MMTLISIYKFSERREAINHVLNDLKPGEPRWKVQNWNIPTKKKNDSLFIILQ
jgi:hypothetical protein